MRIHAARPRVAHGLGVAIAVLLVAAGAVAVTRSGPGREVFVAAAGSAEPLPAPAFDEPTSTTSTSTTPTSTPTTTSSTAAPSKAPATPRPVPKPAPTAPKSPSVSPTLGPRPPEAVAFPYQAGRNSWEATSNGISLRVRTDPPAPHAGEPVRFTVDVAEPGATCCSVAVVFGDGGQFNETQSDGSHPDPTCAQPPPSARTAEATHIYNRAGRWEFLVEGIAGGCGPSHTYGSIYAYLEVGPGTATPQGPAQPTIDVGEYRAPTDTVEETFVRVFARARDEDGFIAGFTVDYGDGTPAETYAGDPMGCRQSASGWPAASMAYLPQNPPPSHRYAAGGDYVVTVTVTSTGCDGTGPQTATGTFDWPPHG